MVCRQPRKDVFPWGPILQQADLFGHFLAPCLGADEKGCDNIYEALETIH